MSLRIKDRVMALKWGQEALAVFEELLSMEPKDALTHPARKLIDQQMVRPEEMTGADPVRRRALGNVGARIIPQSRAWLRRLPPNLDDVLGAI